jgi:hypothetical protein
MLRWLAAALIAAAILAAGALEIAWGQAAPFGVEGLSPDERAVVERNLERWRRLPPAERQRLRETSLDERRRLFRDGWSEEPGK